MKIVYNAPNRAPHYGYAQELHQAGILKAFVCGFSRFSPRAPFPEIRTALKRVDHLQTLYVMSLKFRMPSWISDELAYWAKIQIDKGSRGSLKNADIFLFYNGCGLESARWFRQNGGITIVEALNSHVLVQEQIMMEEHRRIGLPWRPFHPREVRRRVAEVEEADYVLLPSRFVKRSFLAKNIPMERLLHVPFPVQKIPGASALQRKNVRSDGIFRILYVGSISVRKGLRYLIEAFRRFKHPQKELWIVGVPANQTGLENLDMPEGIKFLGPLKGDVLQDAYRNATVFCLPSIEEGLALVLSEAMSYGLPIIATENTGIEDLSVEGKGAMVVPIRDAGAIGDCLKQLADDKDFLERKKIEAAEAASYLMDGSKPTVKLAATLMETFRLHQTKPLNGNV
jgi:glycosyltransferase involved in cell wall biosynthesis